MNASKQKKTELVKKTQLTNFKKKQISVKLFEFLEQFMIGNFLITLTQLEKTGSIGKYFIWKVQFGIWFLFGKCNLRHFQLMNFN